MVKLLTHWRNFESTSNSRSCLFLGSLVLLLLLQQYIYCFLLQFALYSTTSAHSKQSSKSSPPSFLSKSTLRVDESLSFSLSRILTDSTELHSSRENGEEKSHKKAASCLLWSTATVGGLCSLSFSSSSFSFSSLLLPYVVVHVGMYFCRGRESKQQAAMLISMAAALLLLVVLLLVAVALLILSLFEWWLRTS